MSDVNCPICGHPRNGPPTIKVRSMPPIGNGIRLYEEKATFTCTRCKAAISSTVVTPNAAGAIQAAIDKAAEGGIIDVHGNITITDNVVINGRRGIQLSGPSSRNLLPEPPPTKAEKAKEEPKEEDDGVSERVKGLIDGMEKKKK